MSDRVWHKGPPPFPGWWNASGGRDDEIWRWWDGKNWSELATPSMSAGTAAHQAGRKHWRQTRIEWSGYWPKNARVPRLDPKGGHWNFNADDKPPPYVGFIDVAFRRGPIEKAVPPFAWVGFDWKRSGLWSDILAWRPAA